MKVFYPVFQWAKPSMQGVLKKVSNQTEAIKKIGVEIKTLIYGFHNSSLPQFAELEYVSLEPKAGTYTKQLLEIRRRSFERAITDIRSSNPDLIYSRYFMSDPLSIMFLKKIPRKIPVIFESQAIVPKELLQQKKYHYYLFEKLFHRALSPYVTGIIGVTDEIAKYEKRKNPSAFTLTVPNGIGVNSVPLRKYKPNHNEISLLFVGSVNRWHALDRVIQGMSLFGEAKSLHLHIVGTGDQEGYLKTLTKNLGLEQQVTFHGYKSGKLLDEAFENAHIAIASLGIHRNGIKEASVLKAREYCARGIPFIYGYNDPDFDSFRFTLKVPPTDAPIGIEEIIEFAKKTTSDPNHPALMREYAYKNLDWSVKMKKTVAFFEQILAERRL